MIERASPWPPSSPSAMPSPHHWLAIHTRVAPLRVHCKTLKGFVAILSKELKGLIGSIGLWVAHGFSSVLYGFMGFTLLSSCLGFRFRVLGVGFLEFQCFGV